MEKECIRIDKKEGVKAISLLKKHNLLIQNLKIKKEKNTLIIPVKDAEKASLVLSENRIKNEKCHSSFEEKTKKIEEIVDEVLRNGGIWRSSYHQVGDIIIFNAKTEEEVKKLEITAKKLLEYFPYFKAAYAKIKTIGEHRTPQLVYLAGEKRTTTIVKEHGIRFFVDVKNAYYNPRFSEEHHRIASTVKDGENILDMFTGVGGFCLHIATSKKTTIYCNDINPKAIALLHKSIFLNKKKIISNIYIINTDAKNLKEVLYEIKFDRIIMNNPTQSLEFLPIALNIAKQNSIIHFYLLEEKTKIKNKAEHIKQTYNLKLVNIREIMEYSPAASIYRLDFKIL